MWRDQTNSDRCGRQSGVMKVNTHMQAKEVEISGRGGCPANLASSVVIFAAFFAVSLAVVVLSDAESLDIAAVVVVAALDGDTESGRGGDHQVYHLSVRWCTCVASVHLGD